MLAVPLVYNFQVNCAVAGLASDDLAAALEPLKPDETLVVFTRHRSSQKCFNTCIDLLLSKQIAAYVVASLPRGSGQPDSAAKATLHRQEQGSNCENKMVIPKSKSSNENRPGTVAYALQAAADQGMSYARRKLIWLMPARCGPSCTRTAAHSTTPSAPSSSRP